MTCDHVETTMVLVTVGDDEETLCQHCASRVVEDALNEGVDAAEITVEEIPRDDLPAELDAADHAAETEPVSVGTFCRPLPVDQIVALMDRVRR